MTKMERMKELAATLNKAAKVYYQDGNEIMSNFEYDQLYDELQGLEKELGTVLGNSPTQRVGYEVLSELPKENHQSPMLSLDKTKEVERLQEWLGEQKALLSWKLDGLTIVLTYENGELIKAVTRGNGQVGEVITANARVFQNVPRTIGFKGNLVLRGEAVIKYSDFEKINEKIPAESQYKNPRNLCSGSVRQLNSQITSERMVYFYAFSLVQAEGVEMDNSRARQFAWLEEQGFDVVEHYLVDRDTLPGQVAFFAKKITTFDVPSDGLVLLLEDIAYGESLGQTAKFPRNAIAFKWADEEAETVLKEVEWSASRTGLINPVAIFEPVELEGTTVSRASMHNVSIVKQFALGLGDRIKVYKANMIIPQISENLTKSGTLEIPKTCPVCGERTEIKDETGVETLYCVNPDCLAKKVKSFSHFVGRDAMNLDGVSESTIEKFIGLGILKEPADLFKLEQHRDIIVNTEGFGEKSYENLTEAAKKASHVALPNFLNSLGITGIGLSNTRMIVKALGADIERLRHVSIEELMDISGVGEVLAKAFVDYFKNEKNNRMVDHLLEVVTLETEKTLEDAGQLEGVQFVITGSVKQFANRGELKKFIEDRGGKVNGSVSSKTNYLINNDSTSASSKNKKAKELGIPIITEDEFMAMV